MRKQQVFPHSVTSIPILAKAKSYTLIVQVEITDKQGINRKDNILRNKRFLLLTLFKAMKSEIRNELFMINEDDERKLTNKELKEMQTGLKLNKDTSNVEMDEDTDDDDY